MRKNVAYPFWLANNSELDRFYGLDQSLKTTQLLESKNYLLTLVSFLVIQQSGKFEQLHEPVDVDKK